MTTNEQNIIRLFSTADRPTYKQLIHLKKADGSALKVIEWISASVKCKCSDFAHMLLNDDVLVSKYEEKSKDEFIREVLKEWLSRNDDDPKDSAVLRTWSALAECVSDAGLDGTLTKAINDTCPSTSMLISCIIIPIIQCRISIPRYYPDR